MMLGRYLSRVQKWYGILWFQILNAQRKFITVERRVNEIVNRLNKTKTDNDISVLIKEKDDRFQETKQARKQEMDRKKAEESAERKRLEEEAALRSYSSAMKSEKMTLNKFDGPVDVNKYEEDFF